MDKWGRVADKQSPAPQRELAATPCGRMVSVVHTPLGKYTCLTMRRLSTLFGLLLLLLLPVLLFSALMAAILLAGIGAGRILMHFVALTLFEAAVLSLMAGCVAGYLTFRILRGRVGDEDSDFVDDDTIAAIPTARFAQNRGDLTHAGVVQYLLANAIYSAWVADPELVRRRSDAEWKELAVELAQGVTALLRAKPPHTRQIRVGAEALRRELTKLGLGEEANSLYDPCQRAVKRTVELNQDHIVEIIRERTWDE